MVDLEADNRDGASRLPIYNESNFQNESIVFLTDARIVPDLSADSFALEYHADDENTKALYMTNEGPIIYAGLSHHSYMLNLQTGKMARVEVAYAFHAKRWRLEVPDGAGNYTAIREISA